MSEIIIASGVTSTGLVAESGDIITVESGGALVNGTVNAGATLNATYGAILEDLTAVTGATVELSGETKTSGAILKGGNTNIAEGTLYYKGTAITGQVTDGVLTNLGGAYRFCPGAGITVLNATVGGETAVGDRIYAWETAVVSGGQVTTSGNIGLLGESYGNEVTVGGEGVTNATYNLFDNATAGNTTVNNGGTFTVRDNTAADGVTVNSSGKANVSSGGVANNITINSAGTATISGGAVAHGVTVNSGGKIAISPGGVVHDLVANPGATFDVREGVTILGGTIIGHSGATAQPWLQSGGYISGVTLTTDVGYNSPQNYSWLRLGSNNAGNQASASDITIERGAKMQINNGYAENTVIVSKGGLTVFGFANAEGEKSLAHHTIVRDGGSAYVNNAEGKTNGSMTDTWINSGGTGLAGGSNGAGGTMLDTVLNSGGTLTVSNNGVATLDDHPWIDKSHLTVKTGGTVTSARNYSIYYGVNDGVTGLISRSDREEDLEVAANHSAVIFDGAVVSGAAVAEGGKMTVSGGWVSGATFVSGAVFSMTGGEVSGATFENGFTITGGTLSGATLLNPGNEATTYYYVTKNAEMVGGVVKTDDDPKHVVELRVSGGASIHGVTFETDLTAVNANINYTRIGWTGNNLGYAYDTIVQSGAKVQINNGSAWNTTVKDGGQLAVYGNAAGKSSYAENITLSGNGVNTYGGYGALLVCNAADGGAGVVSNVTVGSGGYVSVGRSGAVFEAKVSNGGWFRTLDPTASASGVVVSAGGTMSVSGGTIEGFELQRGAMLYASGGTFIAPDIQVKGAGSSAIFVSGGALISGGTVRRIATDATGNANANFSNAILRDVTFATEAQTSSINLLWATFRGGDGRGSNLTIDRYVRFQVYAGEVTDTFVTNGGLLYMNQNGKATDTIISGAYNGYNAHMDVNVAGANAKILRASVGSGGVINVISTLADSIKDTIVNSGGKVVMSKAQNTIEIGYNPFVDDYTPLVTNTVGATVNYLEADPETYNVYYGAARTGLEFRSTGEFADFTVESGKSAILYTGGSMTNAIVQSGGVLKAADAGAVATVEYNPWGGTIVNEVGAAITSQTWAQREYNIYYGTEKGGMVSRANDADGAVVSSGVSMIAFRGAEIEDLTLVKGGRVLLGSGAVVRGLDVNGGYVTFDAAISKGGIAYGASAYDVTLRNGAGVWFTSGAYISGLNIESGGSVNCYYFGKIYDAVVSNGGQMEFRTANIASANVQGGIVLDLAGSTVMNRYMVTRNFHSLNDVLVKANGSVCNASYWICSNAGVTTLGNAFRLDIGGGMVYDTSDNGTTKIYDALHDLTYSRKRTRIGETANYDLKLETTLDYSGLDEYKGQATSLGQCGSALNGVDTGVRWTEEVFYDDTVYLADGLTTGNAWLEIAGADVDGALYGAAANQSFTGAVNLKLIDGSIKNLAAGAAAGGSVKAVNFRMTGGELGGNAYLGGMGDVTDSVSVEIDGGTLTAGKNLYAGALWNKQSAATSVGEVTLTVTAGTIGGNIYGASAVKTGTIATTANDAAKHTAGDVTFSLAGGTAANAEFCAFAGGYATGTDSAKLASVYDVANVTATITGGTWGDAADAKGGRGVFGGIFASGVKATAQNVCITVEAGTVANIFGGGWAQKGGESTVENVEITVTGGTVANIFGCGMHSVQGNSTTSVGDVSIRLAGGNVTGSVFARGLIDGDAVTGDVTVTVTGSANYGCGFYGFSRTASEDDKAELVFADYTGTISGEVNGFKEITLAGDTAMAFAPDADISNTAWLFDATERTDATAVFASCAAAEFAGTTITLSLADEAEPTAWSLFAGGESTTYGEFDVLVGGVSILPDALVLDQQIADGDYAGWGFTVEDTVLKFKNLA